METLIYELISYGERNGLIPADDINYRINVLAEMLGKTGDELYAGSTPTDFKGGQRGIEINQWLSEHQVDAYCVVDDETVDIVPYIDNSKIVKTDMKYGLTIEDARRIIDVLNNKGEQK
jgi:hypothetical protein